jgi:hypothetical protein
MSVFVDCHVHWYSGMALESVYAAAWENALQACALGGAPAPEQVALLLTEREGQEEFRSTLAGPLPTLTNLSIKASPEGSALIISSLTEPRRPLLLVAGRQFVSRERLEVLSLCLNLETEPALPAADLVEAIVSAGGVPCLPWSPGKWLFGRGRLVRALCAQFPREITLGDISMRPRVLPALSAGRVWAKGIPVLAGSDPLPLAGEENEIGAYGVLFLSGVDEHRPGGALAQLLRSEGVLMGARNSLGQAARRWIKLKKLLKNPRP